MRTLRAATARLPLRWRTALGFGLGALLVTGLLAGVTWNLATEYLLRQRESTAVRLAELNVRLLDAELRAGSEGLGELLQGLSTDAEATVLLQRPDGWTTSGRHVSPEALPPELRELVEQRVAARPRLVVSGVPVRAVTLPTASVNTRYVELFPLSQLDRRPDLPVPRRGARRRGGGQRAARAPARLVGGPAQRPLTELNRAASRVAAGTCGPGCPSRTTRTWRRSLPRSTAPPTPWPRAWRATRGSPGI